MQVTKCDICKKTMDMKKESIWLAVRRSGHDSFEICYECGKPIMKILKSKKLIGEKNGKKK